MDAEERFHNNRLGCVKYCIHTKHNIPLSLISLNWTAAHVSVKGQIVVNTCQGGSLKFSKYQDFEDEVEEQMQKWQTKKLIATTVSSREKGRRRREEGKTTSSQRMISLRGNQEKSMNNLMNVDDDSPTHMRNNRNNKDDDTKRMEELRGKGGGRLKHRTVDGDVPLCLRKIPKRQQRRQQQQKKDARRKGKRKQHSE